MKIASPPPARIVVIGSLNLDLVAAVNRLPAPGETIAATGSSVGRGGKGANQALAAARQGGRVDLIGCVGDDEAGRDYRRFLRSEGVGVGGVGVTRRQRTGTAMITVDARGENQIVVVPGANALVDARAIRQQAALIARANIVVAQFEVPLAAVREASEVAARTGVPFLLNPSPWRDDFPWGEVAVSTLVLNETEAAGLFRVAPSDLVRRAPLLRRRLRSRGVGQVVITRGAQPTLCITPEGICLVPGLRVRPIDTVGAGDAFTGALAVRLAEGDPLRVAVGLANCAGALATLALGAQASLPSRSRTERAAARAGLAREG